MVVRIPEGGTGQTTAPGARIALGLSDADIIAIVGTPAGAQPLDADLTAIAALSTTSYGRGFLELADQAAARTYMTLGTMALENTTNYTNNAGLAATYLTIANASSTYLTQANAASTYLTIAAGLTSATAAATYLPLAGGTTTGTITRSGTSGTIRDGLTLATSGTKRWEIVVDDTAESGSNLGSDFQIRSYDDAGTTPTTAVEILRSNGQFRTSSFSVPGSFVASSSTPINADRGLKLNPFGIMSSDANTLDFYEEGTWTPTWVASTGAFGSITYTAQYGHYTRIGNMVFLTGRMTLSAFAVGTGSGNTQISGLPYAVDSAVTSTSWIGGGNCNYALNFTTTNPFFILAQPSVQRLWVWIRAASAGYGASGLTPAHMSSTADLIFSAMYRTTT